MEILRIREQLQKLNLSLENIEIKPKTDMKIIKYIPEYKLDSYKEKLVLCVKQYIGQLLNQLEATKEEINKEEIMKRQEYAEKQIKHFTRLIKEYDSEKMNTIQSLQTTIEHLKGYNSNPMPAIRVSEEDTVKIFKFLSTIRFEEKYVYLRDYLQRKIQFDFEAPTTKEIDSLKKLKIFLRKK